MIYRQIFQFRLCGIVFIRFFFVGIDFWLYKFFYSQIRVYIGNIYRIFIFQVYFCNFDFFFEQFEFIVNLWFFFNFYIMLIVF